MEEKILSMKKSLWISIIMYLADGKSYKKVNTVMESKKETIGFITISSVRLRKPVSHVTFHQPLQYNHFF